jgi:hypothetical protein
MKRKIDLDWHGRPNFYRCGGGACIKISGKEYFVIKVLDKDRYLIGISELFGYRDKLVLKRDWSGWFVRKPGLFDY